MRFTKMATAALFTLAAGQAAAVNVNWTDWQTRTGATVDGQLIVGATTVDVTYSNSAGSIAFAQLTGGIDYWQNAPGGRNPAISPYTSVGPNGNDNIPTGTDVIALAAQATHTLTFSEAISGIYFGFMSINGNTLTFDTPVSLLSATLQNIDGNGTDAGGYWGTGNPTVTTAGSDHVLTGNGEAHGTLFIPGSFSTLSFTTSIFENWHGFTVGVAGLAPPPPPAIPLPAAGLLMIGALGALAGLRRSA